MIKEKQIKHTIYLEARRQALQALLKGFVVNIQKKEYQGQLELKKEYQRQLEEIKKEIKINNYIKELSNNKEKLPF